MSKLTSLLTICAFVAGCSSTGGIYNPSDGANSEFSIGNTVLSAVAVAAVIAVAKNSGGGGGSDQSALVDVDWAWDEFYNQYNQLVWACRGIQTGQFAVLDKCTYKAKRDLTWPAKSAP